MKVTVKTFLNVRVGKPSVNAPCYQYLAPGTELEVDGNLYPGDRVEGIDTWLKDEAGNYYWSGGVNYAPIQTFTPESRQAEKIILSELIGLKTPLQGKGDGITIGIFDSGIDLRHSSLKAACISIDDFLTHPDPLIKCDHGTRVAGIIAANSDYLEGLAPESKLRIFRTCNSNGYTDDDAVIAAFEHILKNSWQLDILNLSLDITYAYIPLVEKYVGKLTAQGTTVVVAGYSSNLDDVSNIAQVKGAIPIGIIKNEKEEIENLSQNGFKKEYKLAYLNKEIQTLGFYTTPDSLTTITSSSAYAAVTTGLLAKLLSSTAIPLNKRAAAINQFLTNCDTIDKVVLPYKPYRNENT